MGRRFILASASPARLQLLCDAGLDPEVMVSGIEEIGDDVQALAEAKAVAVAARPESAGAIVLGCDSLLDLDGRMLGKPATPKEATERWQEMRGRTGRLRTGHCVVDGETSHRVSAVAVTTVRFGAPTDAEIDAYVATGEPLSVAGAFTVLGRSAPFIDGVDGDPGNVIGVSLPLLRSLLGLLGLEVTSLWS